MNKIIEEENMNLNEKTKNYILDISNGSVRIMINNIEKCFVFNKKINFSDCQKLCTTISFQHFDEYYQNLINKDLKKAINNLYDIYDYGYSVIDILDYLFFYTKKTDQLDENTKYEVIILLCKYITIFHSIHEDSVELALLTNNISKLF